MAEEEKPRARPELVDKETWRHQLLAKLNTTVPNVGQCKECLKQDISVSSQAVTSIRLNNGGLDFGGTVYPQAMLVCRNCGHTRYFNLIALGLPLPKSEPDDGSAT